MKPREPSRRHARCDLDAVSILDPNDEHALNVRPAVMPLSSSAPTVTPKTPITICALYVHLRSSFTDMNDRHDRLFDGYRLEVQVSMPMSFQPSTPNVICSGRRTLPPQCGVMTDGLLPVAPVTVPAALVGVVTETGIVIVVETAIVTVLGKEIVRGTAMTVTRTARISLSGGVTPPTGVGVLLLVAMIGPGLRPPRMT